MRKQVILLSGCGIILRPGEAAPNDLSPVRETHPDAAADMLIDAGRPRNDRKQALYRLGRGSRCFQ